MPFRIVAGVLGAFFLLQGLNWLLNPVAAAEALGMPLLEGVGRSTQVGDLSSFFLCLGGFALFGAWRRNGTWLRAAGTLVGLVALTRTVAWAAHGASFTTTFVVVEVVAGSLLSLCATRVEADAESAAA